MAAFVRCFVLLCALSSGSLLAQGDDHPLVGRYAGAELLGQHGSDFDEVAIIDGPIVDSMRGVDAPGWLRLEGKSSLYYYRLPVGRSTLEVLRNYESSLKTKGFETVFTCVTSNGSCYRARPGRTVGTAPYDFALAYDAAPELPRLEGDFIRNYFGTNARYLLSKRSQPAGAVYASIVLAEHDRGNHAFVRVVETQAMDTGMIEVVRAEEMKRALDDSGRISLYGIHFDFDKADIKAESSATLDEIATLLRTDPSLKLTLVGHTDAQGGADYNMALSGRRAEAVAAALRERGIEDGRLSSRGAGASEPVAGNDSEDGRARNRRVELVRR